MCKHSTETVDKLAERQRGLDARGNDPMATKRESGWAVAFVRNPPQEVLENTVDYLKNLPDKINGKPVKFMQDFKQNRLAGLIPGNGYPTAGAFTGFFADKTISNFKAMMDAVGEDIGDYDEELKQKARDQLYFQDRGRDRAPPRPRRQSMDSRHAGITTGMDRTPDTKDVYAKPLFHAKGQFRADLNSETVKQFQKSGAPYIGGASGTMQFVAMTMEHQQPIEKIDLPELDKRERILAMLAAQHVAIGHHSMAECLLGVKDYGYFKDVPDPLVDYDGAMQALDKRLKDFGFNNGPPLSRDGANQGKSPKQVDYEDKLAFVRSLYERYRDQISPTVVEPIEADLLSAEDHAALGRFDAASGALRHAEIDIQRAAEQITVRARGNNRVLSPNDLIDRMGAAPKRKKGASVEYKVVMEALANYDRTMKQLAGRTLEHDQIELGFEELRASLETVEKAATAYTAKHAGKKQKDARATVMNELNDRLKAEQTLLFRAEEQFMNHAPPKGITIEQAIEFYRFGISIPTQVEPSLLKESSITHKEVLGSGGVSTVMKIDYAKSEHNQAKQVAFKPELEKAPPHLKHLNDLGIDPDKPRFGKRNIATSKIAKAVGLDGLIPEATFTTVDGKVGLAMELAGGDSPARRRAKDVKDPANHPDLQKAVAAKNDGDPAWKAKIPEKNSHGMRYQYDDKAKKFTVEEVYAVNVPLASPPGTPKQVAAVQQQLVNLQWLDALCGQTDRHIENYLIDSSKDPPTVTGIDHDFAFGKNRKNPAEKRSNSLGFPPVIDKRTFDALMNMDWDQVVALLRPELDTEEIAATKTRLDAIQGKLKELQAAGMVLASWDQTVKGRSVTEILTMQGSGGFTNYVQRDVEWQKTLPH